jgi:hypothetical protein
MLRDELAITFDLILGALQPGIDARADHRPLELGEGTRDLKPQLASRRRRVDALLIKIQIDAARLEVLNCADQIDQRSPEPINCPGHHHVEFASARLLQHAVKARPLVPDLSPTDAGVPVNRDYFPAAALGNLAELADLVLNRFPREVRRPCDYLFTGRILRRCELLHCAGRRFLLW